MWDAYQSVQLMYNFGQLITQQKNNDFALRNLQVLAERFYYQARDASYRSSLTQSQISELAQNFVHLTSLIQTKNGIARHDKFSINLQISLLKILRYILLKTKWSLQGYKWNCNAVKLSLQTAIYCHDEQEWSEMEFCLSEADFHLQQHVISDLPPEFHAPFLLNQSLRNILHLLWMYRSSNINDAEIIHLLPSLFDESSELTRKQMKFLYLLFYNVGLSCHRQQLYVEAINCLKVSISFANRLGKHNLRISKILSLLAICFFNLNAVEYFDEIHHILTCTDESASNLILEFRTYSTTKIDVNAVTSCILKYFKIQLDCKHSDMRSKICQIFRVLEKKDQQAVIVRLLNEIPWREKTCGLKWICAEMAVRTCIQHHYLKGCYQWLTEIAGWQPSELVDRESTESILFHTEKEAIRFFNMQKISKAVQWYEALVNIGLRHGGLQTETVRNAVHCALAMGTAEGLESAKWFLTFKDQIEADLQLLRFKLLIAIRDQDQIKAVEAWLQLNARYKEGNVSADWKEGKDVLEECIFWAVKNQMNETLVHCLNLVILQFKNHFQQFSIIIDVIKIHLNVLFNIAAANSSLETKCMQHLLTALISAYNLCYQETLTTSQNHHWDSGGLELWFGNWAWNLGRKFHHMVPFYRHQLYKLSYKMFSLTLDQDQSIRSKIETAMVLSLAAGINSESQEDPPYMQILNGCTAIIKDYVDTFSKNIKLVYFYQFFILCQLGDLKTVTKTFEGYQEAGEQIKNDSEFFEGLSVLASSHSAPFLAQILPSVERQIFSQRIRQPRQLKFQIKLNEVAIQSLGIANAIHLKSGEQTVSYRMSINWRRMISIGSEHFFLLDDIETRYFNLCEEYLSFLRINGEQLDESHMNFLFNQVWNLVMEIETYKGLKAAQRWIYLIADISNYTPELQKLYRSLRRRISICSP